MASGNWGWICCLKMTDNRKPAWEKEDGLRTPDFGREFDTRWSPPWWKTSGKWNNMVLEGFVSVNVSGRRTGESNTPPYLFASIHYCSLCGYMAIINACHFLPSVQILSTMFFQIPDFLHLWCELSSHLFGNVIVHFRIWLFCCITNQF